MALRYPELICSLFRGRGRGNTLMILILLLGMVCVMPAAADVVTVTSAEELKGYISNATGPDNMTRTIVVAADFSVGTISDGELMINATQDITLVPDTSGRTITLTATSARSLFLVNGGNLTIAGNATSSSVVLTLSGNGASRAASLVNVSAGNFTLLNGVISNNTATSGGGVYVSSTGNFMMTGGIIRNNTATASGGGVCVATATGGATGGMFTMSGGSVIENTAQDGGGVYASDGVTISGGKISGNTANLLGGGLYLVHENNMPPHGISGGEISGNSARNAGGGLYLTSGTIFSVDSCCNISDNVRITGNTAGIGGGIYITSNSTLSMTGGVISGNSAGNAGGEIQLQDGWLILSGPVSIGPNNTSLVTSRFINVTESPAFTGSVTNISLSNTSIGARVVVLPAGTTSGTGYLNKFALSPDLTLQKMVLKFNGSTALPQLEIGQGYVLTVAGGVISDVGGPSGLFANDTDVSVAAQVPAGMMFVEWQSDAGGTFASVNAASTTFRMPVSDTNVTAKFQPIPSPTPTMTGGGDGGNTENSFRVLFDSMGGSFVQPVTGLSYGDVIKRPADPAKTGSVFAGWYRDETYGRAWNFDDGITGDMTLYAKWTAAEVSPTGTATSKPPHIGEVNRTPTVTDTPTPAVTATTAETTQAPALQTPLLGACVPAGLLVAGLIFRRKL